MFVFRANQFEINCMGSSCVLAKERIPLICLLFRLAPLKSQFGWSTSQILIVRLTVSHFRPKTYNFVQRTRSKTFRSLLCQMRWEPKMAKWKPILSKTKRMDFWELEKTAHIWLCDFWLWYSTVQYRTVQSVQIG